MNWIKTADRLPEDQLFNGDAWHTERVIVSEVVDGYREYYICTFSAGEFYWEVGGLVINPDYWCEIELPE